MVEVMLATLGFVFVESCAPALAAVRSTTAKTKPRGGRCAREFSMLTDFPEDAVAATL